MWTTAFFSLLDIWFTFQTRLEGDQCVSAQFFQGASARDVYLAFAITLFFSHYAVPCACFFILYGMVVITMQRRKRDSQFETNR